MYNEITKSLKAALYERMGSPFLSSLIIFFIYFNWKAILIVLWADNPVQDRIQEIEESYVNSENNITLPLVYALIYSIAYPYISLVMFGIQEFAVELKRKLRGWINKGATISVEKYLELKSEMLRSKSEVHALMEENDSEITGLKEEVESLSAEIIEISNNQGLMHEIDSEKRESFRLRSMKIIEKLIDMLGQDKSKTLASVWRNYGSKIQEARKDGGRQVNDYDVGFRSMTSWCQHINERVKSENYQGVIQELSEYIRQFVGMAENIRSDFKSTLGSSVVAQHINKAGGEDTIKEQWNVARENANEIIKEWEELLLDCVSNEHEYLRYQNFNKILTIGDSIRSESQSPG